MAYKDFISVIHNSTTRDYLARVNNPDYPKAKAAKLAKQWGYDYWDGNRAINYGGYHYMPGRWEKVAREMIKHYKLPNNPKILDVGCGKGYLLFDFLKVIPDAEIFGIDISNYAIENSKEEIRKNLRVGNATELPWPDNHFDLVYSMNTFHNLYNYELYSALKEIERVSKQNKYVMQEAYRNEREKVNMLNWQLTQHSFYSKDEWEWFFKLAGYKGDYGYIYFE